MVTIYHNPRCGKSREGLAVVEDSGIPFEAIQYMDKGLTIAELKDLLRLLRLKPLDLIRVNEKIWKEKYKGKNLSDYQAIKAMAAHPSLIERPVVVYEGKAVIGRPAEKIKALLKS